MITPDAPPTLLSGVNIVEEYEAIRPINNAGTDTLPLDGGEYTVPVITASTRQTPADGNSRYVVVPPEAFVNPVISCTIFAVLLPLKLTADVKTNVSYSIAGGEASALLRKTIPHLPAPVPLSLARIRAGPLVPVVNSVVLVVGAA